MRIAGLSAMALVFSAPGSVASADVIYTLSGTNDVGDQLGGSGNPFSAVFSSPTFITPDQFNVAPLTCSIGGGFSCAPSNFRFLADYAGSPHDFIEFGYTSSNGSGSANLSFDPGAFTHVGSYSVGPASFSDDAVLTVASGVPEPSTWAMIVLGFAAIGLLANRRKSKPTSIVA